MVLVMSIRVLHLVSGGLMGLMSGAARGAYWLHSAQRELGIDSTLMTDARDNLDEPSIILLSHTPLQKLKYALLGRLAKISVSLYRNRQARIFSTGFEGVDFSKHPAYQSADLVHLHWINGLVRIRMLRKIDKPIVWTMRDMWPLTGGCHYSMECERYKVGCGRCPQLGSQRSLDLSRLVVFNKRAYLPKNLRVIGVSHWVSECAKESRIFHGFEVETISNNVDVSQFYPVDSRIAREALGLTGQKRVALVGAQQIKDFYKGFSLLVAALKFLKTDDIRFVVFGKATDRDLSKLGVDYTKLGFLSDTVSLRLAYSAADVFVAPYRMDAFPKTLAEAMACGTPVVCFDATGPKDIVEHQITGYKAIPFDPADLARGVQWILDRSTEEYAQLCAQALERVQTHFDSRVIARQYLALYQRLLSRRVQSFDRSCRH
jgi:glycosyltransferase involved in cell wall biosynthesis